MIKRVLILVAAIAALGYTVHYWPQLRMVRPEVFLSSPLAQTVNDITDPITHDIIAPPPLRHTDRASSALSINGIIEHTNIQRAGEGAKALAMSPTLNRAAQNKVDDLFARQYFEHISPDGQGPADLANTVGYAYLRIGENLALGNFAGDQGVVDAWMNSPGHRANIVAPGYTEIGVAAKEGLFEGQRVWIAVQEFGTPQSVCPAPDQKIKSQIDSLQARLTTLQPQLDEQRTSLDDLIASWEEISNEAKKLAREGNAKIEQGNANIAKGNEVYQETGSQEQAQPYWDQGEREQKEGRALLEQAEAQQDEANAIGEKITSLRETYNAVVKNYNDANSQLDALATIYNSAVQAYNACAQEYK